MTSSGRSKLFNCSPKTSKSHVFFRTESNYEMYRHDMHGMCSCEDMICNFLSMVGMLYSVKFLYYWVNSISKEQSNKSQELETLCINAVL